MSDLKITEWVESDQQVQKVFINGYELRLTIDEQGAMLTALDLQDNVRQTIYLNRPEFSAIKQLFNSTDRI